MKALLPLYFTWCVCMFCALITGLAYCASQPEEPVVRWYQSTWCPYIQVTKDGTQLRLYGATPSDYAEVTVTYHGDMTPQKALKQLKPYIKK